MRVVVVDNYDSFTWNLVHYLIVLGAAVEVVRNDAMSAGEIVGRADGVVISPGPGTPDGAGVSLDVVAACAEASRPLLGVCLGHQAIGQHFGGTVTRAERAVHGKTSAITHDGLGVFAGLPSHFDVARYHSLALRESDIPACLTVSARADDGVVMGVRHVDLPIEGVQFHPESVASEHGHAMLVLFLQSIGATR